MGRMRALFVLATVLCLTAPPLCWGARGAIDPASGASSSMSLAAAPTAATQVSRAIAKVDRIFGLNLAIAAAGPALVRPAQHDARVSHAPDAPSLDLENPPLAARPPPLS